MTMETSTPIIPGFRQALLTFLKRVDYRIPHFMIRSVGPMQTRDKILTYLCAIYGWKTS